MFRRNSKNKPPPYDQSGYANGGSSAQQQGYYPSEGPYGQGPSGDYYQTYPDRNGPFPGGRGRYQDPYGPYGPYPEYGPGSGPRYGRGYGPGYGPGFGPGYYPQPRQRAGVGFFEGLLAALACCCCLDLIF